MSLVSGPSYTRNGAIGRQISTQRRQLTCGHDGDRGGARRTMLRRGEREPMCFRVGTPRRRSPTRLSLPAYVCASLVYVVLDPITAIYLRRGADGDGVSE